jgi:hypothetical protein
MAFDPVGILTTISLGLKVIDEFACAQGKGEAL